MIWSLELAWNDREYYMYTYIICEYVDAFNVEFNKPYQTLKKGNMYFLFASFYVLLFLFL